LPLEFLYTGAYAPLYGSLKAANWYYLNHFPVSAILSNEQALQACRAPSMGETEAVSPSYFPLFARLSTLPANATVSPVILTRQLKQLVPIQYQWYQAQLRTQAIQTDTSQVGATGEHDLTDEEVADIQTYLENNPPGDGPLIAEVDDEVYNAGRYPGPTMDARVGADGIAYKNNIRTFAPIADFFFGDFITLADPEASLGEKALATTFILVKPAKVGEVVYDLSKARKVKTGGEGTGKEYKKYKAVEYNGSTKINGEVRDTSRRVYQRIDIDYGVVDPKTGKTNYQLMKSGRPPIWKDGTKIELHHLIQREPGSMVELPSSMHKEYDRILHGLVENGGSFRNDPVLKKQYENFRSKYWRWRARQIDKGEF
jgi:toxin YxiD